MFVRFTQTDIANGIFNSFESSSGMAAPLVDDDLSTNGSIRIANICNDANMRRRLICLIVRIVNWFD